MKNYNEFINESLRNQMKGKSVDDIKKKLSKLPLINWFNIVKTKGLDDQLLPTDEEIRTKLSLMDIGSTFEVIRKLKL
jgi:hypothetical protein